MVVLPGHLQIVVRNDADLPHECRGFPRGWTRIFRACGRGSSAQTDTGLPCRFRLKMAETRRQTSCTTTLKDQETHRKDRSNYHHRNRTYLDMKYGMWHKKVTVHGRTYTHTSNCSYPRIRPCVGPCVHPYVTHRRHTPVRKII